MTPAVNAGIGGTCDKAWFGWYCSEKMEALRNEADRYELAFARFRRNDFVPLLKQSERKGRYALLYGETDLPAAQLSHHSASRKDNPYLRPFGKLSTEELEKSIQETEKAIVQCQAGFGNPDVFKDASRGQKLHEDYQALEKKLKKLEEEYFARGK